MSTGRYLLGAAELAVIFAALGLGAYHLRALLAPAWTGALARLAEVVIGLSMLILVAGLLGVLGLFKEVPLLIGFVAAGVGTTFWARRRGLPAATGTREARSSPHRGGGHARGAIQPDHGRDRDRRCGLGRRALGPPDRAGRGPGDVLPGHHLVPHVLLGPVCADRPRRPAPLHRSPQAGRLVLPTELRAAPRARDRLPEDGLPLTADQPDVGGALPAGRLVRGPPLRD